MNRLQFRAFFLLLALSLLVPLGTATARDSDDDNNRRKSRTPGALTLPITGAVADGGVLSGTVTINRFARQGQDIVAIGIVRATVINSAGQVVRSGLDTVVLPVQVKTGPRLAGFSAPRSSEPRLIPASLIRTQTTCGILNLDIGGIATNLLGVLVTLSPITLDLSGDTAGPLGALVCEILNTLGVVADVVALLNSLLGLLTGLLGGVVGGIGI
jgi:hypothetical protein